MSKKKGTRGQKEIGEVQLLERAPGAAHKEKGFSQALFFGHLQLQHGALQGMRRVLNARARGAISTPPIF